MSRRAVVLVACIAVQLAGCGQRGPLTLPSRDTDAASMPAVESPVDQDSEVPAEPEPESTAEEEANEPGEDEQ